MAAGADIDMIPPEIMAHAISLTSPRDACRCAAVSPAFRSVADSDAVWKRFLLPDLPAVLSRAIEPIDYASHSKKQLFFRLCDHPVLLADSNMSFGLERSTGAKCYMLPARSLAIAWGDTPRYWRWISVPDSRFAEVAELLFVCWLDVHGKIDIELLSPRTNYAAYLIFRLVTGTYGLGTPALEASVTMGNHLSKHKVCLYYCRRSGGMPLQFSENQIGIFEDDEDEEEDSVEEYDGAGEEEEEGIVRYPRARGDGWMELELGEFYNHDGEDGEVNIRLQEVWELLGKKGLIIHGIEVRPKV